MKIIIVRHADRIRGKDILSSSGKVEAKYVSALLSEMNIEKMYVSSMKRAIDTVRTYIQDNEENIIICDWLREFERVKVYREDIGDMGVPWNFYPDIWTKDSLSFSNNDWYNCKLLKDSGIREEYESVINEFDSVLKGHGYIREGKYYKAKDPNVNTIVFVCHLGTECVILSHLLNVSPIVLFQGICPPTASITTLCSEERREGIAYFRAISIGDVSHLKKNGIQPSISGRYCEVFYSTDLH